MAQESLDLFLEIVQADGTPLKGESTDDVFGKDPHFAIELNSFNVAFEEAGFDKGKEKKKEKKESKGAKASSGADLKKSPEQAKTEKLNQRREQVMGLLDQLRNFQEGRIVVTRRFTVKKGLDSASPGLYLAFCEGMPKAKKSAGGGAPDTKFKTAAVLARKAGTTDKPFLAVTFEEVKVSSYSLSMDGPVPSESVGFEFAAVKIEYARQNAAGELEEYATATGTFQMKAEDDEDI